MVNLIIENRTLLLELFTKEIILNSIPIKEIKDFFDKKPTRKEIKKEKDIEKKDISQLVASEFNIKNDTSHYNTEVYNQQIKEEETKMNLNLPDLNKLENKLPQKKIQSIKPRIQQVQRLLQPRSALIPPEKRFVLPIITPESNLPLQVINQNNNLEINLGKINILALDREVTVIECPGPEKIVLVKKAGKINLTKVKLSQEEIESIIEDFSKKSRIPLMEGIFKAIIGNLSLNAVIADSVAHRFIIYKKSPYSMIEQ